MRILPATYVIFQSLHLSVIGAGLELIRSQLSLFFAHENNQMAFVQQRTSEHVVIQSVSGY